MLTSHLSDFARNIGHLVSKLLPGSISPVSPQTPVVLQGEVTECGLAALAILLGYHGTHVSLEEMRQTAGGTRLGVSFRTLKDIAKGLGFDAHVYRVEMEELATMELPVIAYCRFVHFVVVEQITDGEVVINDPSAGPDRIALEEFSDDFTGLALSISPQASARRQGRAFSWAHWLWNRVEVSDPRWIGAAVLTIAANAGALAFASFAGRQIDQFARGTAATGGLIALFALAVLAFGAFWARDLMVIAALGRMARAIASSGLQRLCRLPAHFFQSRLPSQIVEKLAAPSELIYLGPAISALFDVLGLVAACVLVLWICSWIGALIGITVALEIAAVLIAMSRRGATIAGAATSPLPRVGFAASTLERMEPHFVSGGDSELFSRVAGLHAKTSDPAIRGTVTRIRLDTVCGLIRLARPGITCIASLWAMEHGQLSPGQVGELTILALYMGSLLKPLGQLSGLELLRRAVYQLADLENSQCVSQGKVSRGTPQGMALSLDRLGWRPSPRQPFLFSRLSLNIAAGAQIGIAGRSLSGKSVLAQLICGFLEPAEGAIAIEGKESLAPVDAGAILVTDHGPMTTGTVRDNLLLGGLFDDRILSAALADVGLDREIEGRGGLDLRLEHAGRELSGGQQRRLEVARALVRSPALLVIDEALDGVDLSLERVIRGAIRRRGITLVVISGRAESLAQCDSAINLDDYVSHKSSQETASHE